MDPTWKTKSCSNLRSFDAHFQIQLVIHQAKLGAYMYKAIRYKVNLT